MFNCDCIDTWFIYFPFDQSSIIYRSKLQVQTLREIAIRYIPFIIIIERFNNLSLQIIQWSFIYKISSSYNTHIKLDTEQWQRREGFCVVLVKLSTITCNIWLIKIIASVVDHTGWRNKWSMKIYQTHVFFFFLFFFSLSTFAFDSLAIKNLKSFFLPSPKSNFFSRYIDGIFMNTFIHRMKYINLRQVHFISRTVPLLAFGYLFETSGRVTIVVPFYRWDRSRWPLFRLTESPSWRKFHHFSAAFTVHARSFAGVIGDACVARVARTRISLRGSQRSHLGIASPRFAASVRGPLPLALESTFFRARRARRSNWTYCTSQSGGIFGARRFYRTLCTSRSRGISTRYLVVVVGVRSPLFDLRLGRAKILAESKLVVEFS